MIKKNVSENCSPVIIFLKNRKWFWLTWQPYNNLMITLWLPQREKKPSYYFSRGSPGKLLGLGLPTTLIRLGMNANYIFWRTIVDGPRSDGFLIILIHTGRGGGRLCLLRTVRPPTDLTIRQVSQLIFHAGCDTVPRAEQHSKMPHSKHWPRLMLLNCGILMGTSVMRFVCRWLAIEY